MISGQAQLDSTVPGIYFSHKCAPEAFVPERCRRQLFRWLEERVGRLLVKKRAIGRSGIGEGLGLYIPIEQFLVENLVELTKYEHSWSQIEGTSARMTLRPFVWDLVELSTAGAMRKTFSQRGSMLPRQIGRCRREEDSERTGEKGRVLV